MKKRMSFTLVALAIGIVSCSTAHQDLGGGGSTSSSSSTVGSGGNGGSGGGATSASGSVSASGTGGGAGSSSSSSSGSSSSGMGGGCVAPEMDCNGSCVDVTNDSNNCGACGHDCCQGKCVGSTCQPFLLAGNLAGVNSIAVDGNNVYVGSTTGNYVIQIPKSGGNQIPLADKLKGPQHVAVDANNVYWTNAGGAGGAGGAGADDGSVMSIPIGGGVMPTTWVKTQGRLRGIAVDATSIYWTNFDDNTVNRVAITVPPPQTPMTPTQLASGQNNPAGLVAYGGNLYWTNYQSGSVMSLHIGGMALPKMLTGKATFPWGIAADQTAVYWTNSDQSPQGSVMSIPSGGAVLNLTPALPLDYPVGIAVAAPYVYWVGKGASKGTLWRVPTNGGAPAQPLASMLTDPYDVAIDADCVYVADQGAGEVLKVAK
jgi:hypothetical protein